MVNGTLARGTCNTAARVSGHLLPSLSTEKRTQQRKYSYTAAPFSSFFFTKRRFSARILDDPFRSPGPIFKCGAFSGSVLYLAGECVGIVIFEHFRCGFSIRRVSLFSIFFSIRCRNSVKNNRRRDPRLILGHSGRGHIL